MNDDLSDQSKIRQEEVDGLSSLTKAPVVRNLASDHEMEQSTHDNQRLPRHKFRKSKKLERRKLYRKAVARERERRKEQRRAQEEVSREEYLEHRSAWLTKEAAFGKISAAKRKAREIEAIAAKNMKASITQAASTMSVSQKAPVYLAVKREAAQPKIPQIPNMPVFVPSETICTNAKDPAARPTANSSTPR